MLKRKAKSNYLIYTVKVFIIILVSTSCKNFLDSQPMSNAYEIHF